MNCFQINELIQGELINPNKKLIIHKVSSPEKAEDTDIVFFFNKKPNLKNLNSRLIVTSSKIKEYSETQIVHPNPRLAMAKVMAAFQSEKKLEFAISNQAQVADSVKLELPVSIDAFTSIGENSKIDKNTIIKSNVSIGKNCKIGKGCLIYANVTIYDNCTIGNNTIIHSNSVIGSDGFGYEKDGDKWVKVPQVGGVNIANDVEIGSNTTIDGGCLESTQIESGVKIDNFIHIAHNCKIKKNTLIAGGVLIGGSSEVGENCIVAGDVSIAHNVKVGDNSIVLAKSGVTKDLPNQSKVSGYPAQNHRDEIKFQAFLKRLFRLKN